MKLSRATRYVSGTLASVLLIGVMVSLIAGGAVAGGSAPVPAAADGGALGPRLADELGLTVLHLPVRGCEYFVEVADLQGYCIDEVAPTGSVETQALMMQLQGIDPTADQLAAIEASQKAAGEFTPGE